MTTFAMKPNAVGWMVGVLIVGAVGWAALAAIQRPAKILPPSQLFEGSISEIRGSSTAPLGLNILKSDGSMLQLAMDPLETVVLQGGRVAEFKTLEKGQQVKVRYALKEGKEVARSIEITDPLPMLAPTDPSVPAAPEKPMSEF